MPSDFGTAGWTAWKRPPEQRLAAFILACVVLAGDLSQSLAAGEGDPPPADGAAAADSVAKPKSKGKSSTARDHRISLNFKAAPWSRVLKRVAKHSGLTLVMKKAPPGTFTRNDLNQYSLAEAIWIVNRELEPTGYRLIRQGEFLMILDLDALRSDYRPSVARRYAPPAEPQSASGVRPASGQQGEGGNSAAEPALLESVAPETAHESTPVGKDNNDDDDAIATRRIRLAYFSTPWSQVLPRVAQQSGLILVMKRCPAGTYNHPDFKKYSVPEAIQMLNHELEDTNFRLVRQDNFLIVLYTDDLRTEYDRPVVRVRRHPEPHSDETAEPRSPAAKTNPDIRQVSAVETAGLSPDESPVAGPMLLNTDASSSPPSQGADRQKLEASKEAPSAAQSTLFVPHHGRAAAIAQYLYAALKGRSELMQAGLQGLPSFRVFDVPSAAKRNSAAAAKNIPATMPTTFTIGLDSDHNQLVIEAAPRRLIAVIRVCEQVDAHGEESGAPLELVSADAATCNIAKSLGPELSQLVAQRGPAEKVTQVTPLPSASQLSGNQFSPGGPSTSGEKGISEIIKGLKGDVTVESVPELGILILRGGQSDVDAVMKVIREIERLSVGAAPQIHLLQLQYVNSESFAKLLNEVYKALSATRIEGAGAARQVIQVFPIVKPNAVLVVAPPADMPSVLKLSSELDQPVNPELEFQVFRLRYGYATTVARSVTEFYKTPRALGTSVNVFADGRTNSIIVQARPRDLAEVGRLIEKLDGPTASQATIKVFPLHNGDATSILRLLETLFGTAQRPGTQGQPQQGQPGEEQTGGTETTAPTTLRLSADVRTNSIIALGAPDTLRAVEAVITRLDNSDVHQRETMVIRLKNNAADNVARAITDFVRSQRELQQIDPELLSSVELLEREVFVVSEPISNSLLLSATPRYFSDLKKMITKLDEPPAQVIIQALIVEVELDNTDEFGIEMGFQSPILFDRSAISNLTTLQTTTTVNPTTTVAQNVLLSSQASPGFQFGDPSSGLGTNPAQGAAMVGTQELSNLGVGRVDPNLGFGGLVLSASSESVSALLRALSYKQTIHVLSRPQIRTLDNRMASIQVGQRVPVVYSASVNAVTGTIAPVVQYDNSGIILTVQPRITPEGMIALEAYAEKSQYLLTGGVTLLSTVGGPSITSPIKNITRAEASVNVASGNTVVMGGMITSSDTVTTSKVPWLGDVPIIGQAFRYDAKSSKRTELLIFLTPRVIRDDADDELIKQVETERIHFLVDEAEAMHGPILSNRPPVLEECPPEGLPVAPLMAVPGALPSVPPGAAPRPTPTAPLTPETVPLTPQMVPLLPQPGPFTPPPAPTLPPGTPTVPPGAPTAPLTPPPAGPLTAPPAGPAMPQTIPQAPPAAIPPAAFRSPFDSTPSVSTNGPFVGNGSPMASSTSLPLSGPIPCAPANGKPAGQMRPLEETGAVRGVSFETPAGEPSK